MPLTGSPPAFTSSTKMGGSYMLAVVGIVNGDDTVVRKRQSACVGRTTPIAHRFYTPATHCTRAMGSVRG
jgi:hypothetical protein